ncbi:hypothetical protein EV137_4334 [Kribbella pratensis]|uniref:Uncharacterized protein n=1 Tax=Kribbella pratensis TaxID=2512112 RepID=A0ABY2FGL6_9ACTN|nr:hypothetical protein EV137_4334 [Kribbella pratensis]
MSRIAPIETHYAGCHFRSRLEARWAVFFDSLDIPWLYEPEGYHLGDAGAYLPDFLLYPDTTDAVWFEVKGGFPRSDEIRKGQALSAGIGIRAFIYYAPLGLPAPDSLKSMPADEFTTREELWHWDNQDGWFSLPGGPMRWATNFSPTAFMFSPDDTGTPRTNSWWCVDRLRPLRAASLEGPRPSGTLSRPRRGSGSEYQGVPELWPLIATTARGIHGRSICALRVRLRGTAANHPNE